ncbi:hypothetical protein EJ04DRAFT_59981 [Polyplosphaeria fusca]|uniref:Uncharacterized protein n=1 Tax=Polyplosphaeria fusca TaxID=682080 RepID=A0A9P4R2Z8_9PLEO|nr:hypothetical protein EJ04DRAFT_59981 [Polyplosphaeria fusca]
MHSPHRTPAAHSGKLWQSHAPCPCGSIAWNPKSTQDLQRAPPIRDQQTATHTQHTLDLRNQCANISNPHTFLFVLLAYPRSKHPLARHTSRARRPESTTTTRPQGPKAGGEKPINSTSFLQTPWIDLLIAGNGLNGGGKAVLGATGAEKALAYFLFRVVERWGGTIRDPVIWERCQLPNQTLTTP